MADADALKALLAGPSVWAAWRLDNPTRLDLSEASIAGCDLRFHDLSDVNLAHADLREACLSGTRLLHANLTAADMYRVDLSSAVLYGAIATNARLPLGSLNGAKLAGIDLSGANLRGSILCESELVGAKLIGANLLGANLGAADLSGADLRDADLTGTNLMRTHLKDANLNGCRVYGVAVWDADLSGAQQNDLLVSPEDGAELRTDSLEMAQFLYLIVNNKRIRDVIDTLATKTVLILGRFTPERKKILEAMREELRRRNYLPILFDFEKPASRDLTETISTLAHIARFVIADLTDARSIPQELQLIVPNLPSVPVQPLLQVTTDEYGMFEHFKRYPWVLDPYRYGNIEELLASLPERVIMPAEAKAPELRGSRNR